MPDKKESLYSKDWFNKADNDLRRVEILIKEEIRKNLQLTRKLRKKIVE